MEKMPSDHELIMQARLSLDQLRTHLIEHLEPVPQTTRARLLRLFEVWQQIYLLRVIDLADVAIEMFSHKRLVPGCTLARSILESVAVHYYLYKKIATHIEQCEPKPIHELLQIGVFGGREESSPENAIQVLTAIKHLDREFKGFEEEYNLLSEYAHPNLRGGFGSYAHQDGSMLETTFGLNPEGLDMGPCGLVGLHLGLLVASEVFNRLSSIQPTLIEIANRNAPDSPL